MKKKKIPLFPTVRALNASNYLSIDKMKAFRSQIGGKMLTRLQKVPTLLVPFVKHTNQGSLLLHLLDILMA